ncbi:MAG TPA: hypothetical protein VF696_02640 [Candidatus Paceibacterota bacterium]|jgi:hypothetical protein
MIRRPLSDILGAALVFIAALGGYIIWYGTVTGEVEKAAALSQELGAHGEADSRAALARKELLELGQKEADVYGHLVATDDIVPFLESLEATGERLGTKVEVASVANSPGTPLNTLTLSLRITGDFNAVMRTLGAIEYQTYDTVLTNLTLDTPPGSSAQWSAAATFAVGVMPAATATTTP